MFRPVGRRATDFYHEKHKETRSERDASPLITVRKFNNFIKSALIGSYGLKDMHDARVLDLCGGTGGDFPKFLHGPVKHVVLVDIAHDAVEEAKRRYAGQAAQKRKFSADFLCADAFSLDSLSEKMTCLGVEMGPQSFDLVNCQFALHYTFKSPETAAQVFEVMSYYLKPGGRCVATIPNAQFIMDNVTTVIADDHRRRHVSRPPYFEIEFCDGHYGDSEGERQGDYLFSMGDCVQRVPEFLVSESVLREAAEKHDLKVTMWCPFQEFFQKALDEFPDNRRLAHRLGCLSETIDGPRPDSGAWTCAELYLVVILEKITLLEQKHF